MKKYIWTLYMENHLTKIAVCTGTHAACLGYENIVRAVTPNIEDVNAVTFHYIGTEATK